MAPADIGLRGRLGARLLLALLQLGLVEARAQHVPGGGAVLVLRALLLAGDDDAGRDMGDAHGGIGRVDVLAAGARGAVGVDPAVGLLDLDLDAVVDHRIDPDGGEARVAARVGIEGRDAHQPVHAGLGLQPAIGVLALDRAGRGLDAGLLAVRDIRAARPCSRAARPSAHTCAAASAPSPGSRCRRRRHGPRDRRRCASASPESSVSTWRRAASALDARGSPPRPRRRAPRRPRPRRARSASAASSSSRSSRLTAAMLLVEARCARA